jgi:hypothetical protein
MCYCLLCNNPNQYMQKEKFQNNKGEVIDQIWWILTLIFQVCDAFYFEKPTFYVSVIDYILVCIMLCMLHFNDK